MSTVPEEEPACRSPFVLHAHDEKDILGIHKQIPYHQQVFVIQTNTRLNTRPKVADDRISGLRKFIAQNEPLSSRDRERTVLPVLRDHANAGNLNTSRLGIT